MAEPFRTRTVESPETQEIAPSRPLELKSDELTGIETKASDPLDKERLKLDIWEGEHNRKFITEYFDIGNIDGQFNLKMDTSVIDKYIKSELENRKYEKNTENWKAILAEIEAEIGSERMELFSRIKKIKNYVNVLNKLYKAKELRNKYLISDIPS
jgi:hypothetical protein